MCTSVTRYIGITLLSSVAQTKPRGTKRLDDENTLLLINSYEEAGPGPKWRTPEFGASYKGIIRADRGWKPAISRSYEERAEDGKGQGWRVPALRRAWCSRLQTAKHILNHVRAGCTTSAC